MKVLIDQVELTFYNAMHEIPRSNHHVYILPVDRALGASLSFPGTNLYILSRRERKTVGAFYGSL